MHQTQLLKALVRLRKTRSISKISFIHHCLSCIKWPARIASRHCALLAPTNHSIHMLTVATLSFSAFYTQGYRGNRSCYIQLPSAVLLRECIGLFSQVLRTKSLGSVAYDQQQSAKANMSSADLLRRLSQTQAYALCRTQNTLKYDAIYLLI